MRVRHRLVGLALELEARLEGLQGRSISDVYICLPSRDVDNRELYRPSSL